MEQLLLLFAPPTEYRRKFIIGFKFISENYVEVHCVKQILAGQMLYVQNWKKCSWVFFSFLNVIAEEEKF
jgi:hypothetical protein